MELGFQTWFTTPDRSGGSLRGEVKFQMPGQGAGFFPGSAALKAFREEEGQGQVSGWEELLEMMLGHDLRPLVGGQ